MNELQDAFRAHQSGDLATAERLYLASLAQSRSADALQLLGMPGSTLCCHRCRTGMAIRVSANVRIDGLRVEAQRSACIQQTSGRLQVTNCHLHCDPQHHDHLYCYEITLPIISTSMGDDGSDCGSSP